MANANKKLMPLLPAITMKDDKTKTQKQPGFVIIMIIFPRDPLQQPVLK